LLIGIIQISRKDGDKIKFSPQVLYILYLIVDGEGPIRNGGLSCPMVVISENPVSGIPKGMELAGNPSDSLEVDWHLSNLSFAAFF